MKMFNRLLNSIIICRENSQGKQNDHLKYRIDIVQYAADVERNVPGQHYRQSVSRLVARHFPKRISLTERKSAVYNEYFVKVSLKPINY
jgi:hypothetical protein